MVEERGELRLPTAVQAAAERILGHRVDPAAAEPLEGRHSVVALARPDGSEVVVKWSTSRQVLFAEWTALALLGDLGLDPPVAPRLVGGDAEAAVVVMERLAPGPSLAGLLLGSDGDTARRGLVGLARALGQLHAATIGRAREFELRRASLGPTQSIRYHLVRRLPQLLARIDRWAANAGLVPPPGLADDLERVRRVIVRPGPFLSLVHGDACPDNNRIYGDKAVLLDFQVAAIDHCLLDGSYFSVPFPTCWCMGTLDRADAEAATAAYRDELSKRLPQVADDAFWLPALAEASACWFVPVPVACPVWVRAWPRTSSGGRRPWPSAWSSSPLSSPPPPVGPGSSPRWPTSLTRSPQPS